MQVLQKAIFEAGGKSDILSLNNSTRVERNSSLWEGEERGGEERGGEGRRGEGRGGEGKEGEERRGEGRGGEGRGWHSCILSFNYCTCIKGPCLLSIC